MITVAIEYLSGHYFASATDSSEPWRRITACSHRHQSDAAARRCIPATRRRALRMLRRQTTRRHLNERGTTS